MPKKQKIKYTKVEPKLKQYQTQIGEVIFNKFDLPKHKFKEMEVYFSNPNELNFYIELYVIALIHLCFVFLDLKIS